jgi:hypothetical protein
MPNSYCTTELQIRLSRERERCFLLSVQESLTDDSMVLTARSGVHTMAGEFESATALIARALALDPTCGRAWERSAWLKTFSCQPDVRN